MQKIQQGSIEVSNEQEQPGNVVSIFPYRVAKDLQATFGKGAARVDGNNIVIPEYIANMLDDAAERCFEEGLVHPISPDDKVEILPAQFSVAR